MLFLKVVLVVSKSQYAWVKNRDEPSPPLSRPPANSRPQPRRKMVYCAQSRKVPLNNKSTDAAMPEPDAQNQIVVYLPNETVRLDVRLENETVWLTQEQIANLFGTKRPAITDVANRECCQCENVASYQFQFSMKEAA